MQHGVGPLLADAQHVWRSEAVDQFGLLIDGENYYREFYRAASRAERFILVAGWQFDSEVELLRGQDAHEAPYPVTLLRFLDALCRAKPGLHVWILAWDFHPVFVGEREWLQDWVFQWRSIDRLHFHFDGSHVDGGSHHQKFVVIDGELAFLGGLDLCDHRWDDRSHRSSHPLRTSRGEPHKPFHDIQAYVSGRAAGAALCELFLARWRRAGAEEITLAESAPIAWSPEGEFAIPVAHVSFSRTDPNGTPNGPSPCHEIRDLFVAEIAAAQRSIYIETQYLSSHVIGDALARRMRITQTSKLDIVIVLNMEAETFKEQLAVGLAQAKIIGELRAVAAATGQHLGIYYSLPHCEPGEHCVRATYIHSKLLIIDDRVLSVGSANLTNRSMAVDTELTASVESEAPDGELSASLRRLRAELLEEHTGGAPALDATEGLVARLDELAKRAAEGEPEHAGFRLRPHPSPTEDERKALEIIDPQALPFDPDAVEDVRDGARSIFVGGFGAALRRLLALP